MKERLFRLNLGWEAVVLAVLLALVLVSNLAPPLEEQLKEHRIFEQKLYQKKIEMAKVLKSSGYLQGLLEKETDGDGLPDNLEEKIGTSIYKVDTDEDGLTDYEEYCKYKTDPTKADSDGDGIPDNDWNERREYVFTIQVKGKILSPYDLETMNDFFQDARKIKERKNVLTYEAILYPNTRPVVIPHKYPIRNLPIELKKYTERTTLFNYSAEMQKEIKEIVKDCKTDIEVIRTLRRWFVENTYDPFGNPGPLMWRYSVKNGKVVKMNDGWVAEGLRKWPEKKILETFVYGDSMFKKRTHGTCWSRAILFCTMLRAAGIPARIAINVSFREGKGDHHFNEVFLNGKWIRADTLKGVNVGLCFESIKIISFGDFEHADFASTWGKIPASKSPYTTFEITAQYLGTQVKEK